MHLLSFLLLSISTAQGKKLSEREVNRQQEDLRNGRASPDELSLFDDPVTWSKSHTPAMFKGLDGRGMHKWVKWLSEQSRDRRVKFIQGHTHDDLAQLGAKDRRDYGSACYQLAGLADHLTKSQIDGLREGCASELIKGLVFEHPAWLGQLPKSLIQEHAAEILANLEKNIAEVKPETLGNLLSDPDACKHLSATMLPLLSDQQAKRVNGKCFAAIKEDWDAVEFTAKQLGYFTSDIFEWSQQSELPESLYQHVRKEQLTRWGVRLEKEVQCRNLRIDIVKPAALAGLTTQCMAGMIRGMIDQGDDTSNKKSKRKPERKKKHRTTVGSLELGAQRWAALRTDIFSGLDPTDELPAGLELIPEEEWKRMPVALIEGILSMKGGCLALPSAASQVAWGKLRTGLIDARCFAELNPAIQPAILQHLPSLPDDLLKYVGKSHIRRWEQGGKEGLDCLAMLKSRSNRVTIMSNLSTDLAHAPEQSQWAGQTKHACAAITNLAQINDLSISLTAECVDAIPELSDDADLLKRAPAIIVGQARRFRSST